MKNNNLSRLGMESLTSALITSVDISNELLLNSFSLLIKEEFIQNVISLINSNDLKISYSALKTIKFLILAKIKNVINEKIVSKLLLILLNRSKSSSNYIEKVELGPITKLIDKSASVRSLSFEIITDIIEYDNNYIITSNKEFINLFIKQLMDAIESNDSNLVNYACQSFQIIIRSGYITTKHINKELINCICKEIENAKGDTNKINLKRKIITFITIIWYNKKINIINIIIKLY